MNGGALSIKQVGPGRVYQRGGKCVVAAVHVLHGRECTGMNDGALSITQVGRGRAY